jgi:alkylation response protein AidB-like acyl-CoA dehydrogenase
MAARSKDSEARDWQAEACRIAADIADCAATHDDDDSFVSEGFNALKQAGFFTALVPSALGGGGATVGEICNAIRIVAGACGSTALAFSMHCHLIAVAAWRWKHQNAPTEALLKRVVTEDLILVSSGGSDWLESAGKAEQVDGGFRISARKAFSSGSPVGDLLVTSAVHEDPENGSTVLHFALPLKHDQVKHLATWQVMGMRGSGSNDIIIEGLVIPEAAIAGKRPQGSWHMLFHIISMIAFALIYSAYLGIAESAARRAIELSRKRPPDRLLAVMVGEMENELLTAQLAHEKMVRIAEAEQPGPETTSAVMACRTLVGQHAIAAVTKAMEVAGGAGFYRKNLIERAFRDVQAARFHPLREKQQLDFSGRVALGWDIDAST